MLAFGFLTVLLGGLIALETAPTQNPSPAGSPLTLNLPLARVAAGLGDATQVQAWVTTILARPLFETSRRPPATAATATSESAFPRLAGIMISPGRREAIFAVPGKSQPVVVTAGSRLNGVLIKTIQVGEISVVDSHGTRTIHPSFDKTAGGAPAARALPVTVDLPPVPATAHASPFASIRGLSGRPLGLSADPGQPLPQSFGIAANPPSLPAPASTGGSP